MKKEKRLKKKENDRDKCGEEDVERKEEMVKRKKEKNKEIKKRLKNR